RSRVQAQYEATELCYYAKVTKYQTDPPLIDPGFNPNKGHRKACELSSAHLVSLGP
ncbi:hypothetical protein SARC_18148, partial [Sphaeroforma arctica JP610]